MENNLATIFSIVGLASTAISVAQERHFFNRQKVFDEDMHKEELELMKDNQAQEIRSMKQTYIMKSFTDMEQHFQQLNADLINSNKEYEKDMIDQRVLWCQTIIIAGTIMMTALITVQIQGILPKGNMGMPVYIWYSISNAGSLSTLFISIILYVEVVHRVNRFSIRRAKQHGDLLHECMRDNSAILRDLRPRDIRSDGNVDGEGIEDQDVDGRNPRAPTSAQQILRVSSAGSVASARSDPSPLGSLGPLGPLGFSIQGAHDEVSSRGGSPRSPRSIQSVRSHQNALLGARPPIQGVCNDEGSVGRSPRSPRSEQHAPSDACSPGIELTVPDSVDPTMGSGRASSVGLDTEESCNGGSPRSTQSPRSERSARSGRSERSRGRAGSWKEGRRRGCILGQHVINDDDWQRHEHFIHECLEQRERINSLTHDFITGATFELFWEGKCSLLSRIALWLFYTGTCLMIVAVLLFMWVQFNVYYSCITGSYVALGLLVPALVIGMMCVIIIRTHFDESLAMCWGEQSRCGRWCGWLCVAQWRTGRAATPDPVSMDVLDVVGETLHEQENGGDAEAQLVHPLNTDG